MLGFAAYRTINFKGTLNKKMFNVQIEMFDYKLLLLLYSEVGSQ